MLTTTLILKNKLNSLPKLKRREFLLNCINNSDKKFDFQIINENLSIPLDIPNVDYCKMCKSNIFIRTNFEEICERCGVTRPIVQVNRTFKEKTFEFIKLGANTTTIKKDGKNIIVDLNKINLWIQDADPEYKDTQLILKGLDIIFDSKGITLPDKVRNTAISMWYNFNNLYLETFNKNSIYCLCIFYSGTINDIIISLEQLSLIYKITVSNIILANDSFKKTFVGTEYYEYLNLKLDKVCNIKLNTRNKLLFNKIKDDLIQNFPEINNPIDNKIYASIIYYMSSNLKTTSDKYTLTELHSECGVSTTSVSNMSKKINAFYKNNKNLLKKLIII